MEIKDIHKVYVDPRCMFNYASYYLLGLQTCFPKKVDFNGSLFKDFPMETYEDYRKGVAIIFETSSVRKKVFIDFHDSNKYSEKIYKWADLYCAVNTQNEEKLEKLFVLGPSFGVRVFSFVKLTYLLLSNFYKSRCLSYRPSFKTLLRDYYYTLYRRLSISKYDEPVDVSPDYCFSISTLWYDSLTDKTTNYYRGVFTEIASQEFPSFEGGFYYIDSPNVLKEFPQYQQYKSKYKDLLFYKRFTLKEYLYRIKKSLLVFNTPSVSGCLGWKLPEYLRMGKVILSTKIQNQMPGEFLPNKHYILVADESDIRSAIQNLRDNPKFVRDLSENAKIYYNLYLSPESVINRIIQVL